MRKRWNTAWCLTLRISLAALVLSLAPAIAQSELELLILEQTNAARAAHGLSRLAWDENAARAARKHADDMLERGYFAHETPDGLTPAERMWRAGVLEVEIGENIAFYEGYTPEQAVAKVVDDWMHSPHHRENILRPEFTHLGVGVVRRGERIMLVQDFLARPFSVTVWQTSSRSFTGVLVFSGSSRATVGLFVGGVLNTALQPPNWSGSLQLTPGSRVDVGVWRGSQYYLVCSFTPPETACPTSKINWHASYRQELRDTVLLQISLPQGEYTLAHGPGRPTPFASKRAPINLEAPLEWGAIWIGVSHGGRVEYTHRVTLEK